MYCTCTYYCTFYGFLMLSHHLKSYVYCIPSSPSAVICKKGTQMLTKSKRQTSFRKPPDLPQKMRMAHYILQLLKLYYYSPLPTFFDVEIRISPSLPSAFPWPDRLPSFFPLRQNWCSLPARERGGRDGGKKPFLRIGSRASEIGRRKMKRE